MKVKSKFGRAYTKMKERVASVYEVNINNLSKSPSTSSSYPTDERKAKDLDQLTLLMKEKLKVESFKSKIQVLKDKFSKDFLKFKF